MTLKEVQRRVEEIRASAGDPEAAHSMEDELRADVLEFIALDGGDRDIRELAQAALSTFDIEFPRWCA